MQATTITTARDILPTHGATITDTLDQQPGIGGSTFAPGANRPIIRGLDNNRVRIQENGVSTGGVSDISEDHAYPIDPYSADSITVMRGPSTVRYGSQAIGGVVSAEELLARAWDENADPFTNAVRITVSGLRKRLGEPWIIATVPGVGYRIEGDEP